MGPVPLSVINLSTIHSIKDTTMNNVIIAMLDSGTITMTSTVGETIAKVNELMNQPKVVVRASVEIEESAEDILMFGC